MSDQYSSFYLYIFPLFLLFTIKFNECILLTLLSSFYFQTVYNWPALFPLHYCACFYKASFLCSLADSPLFYPSSLHRPNSLSSGSIKSLLICSFLLIWIHTIPNCWLSSAKETRLNEVYKTHKLVSLSVWGHFFVHVCVFMSTFTHVCVCTCFSLITILISITSLSRTFALCFRRVTLIPVLPLLRLSLIFFLLLSAPLLNPFLKPSHLQIL